jgi:hypothetical protein
MTPRADDPFEFDEELGKALMLGPFPFEHIKPRLIDRIPPALWWWLFGAVCGAMMTVFAIEMFTSIDLGLVPNG